MEANDQTQKPQAEGGGRGRPRRRGGRGRSQGQRGQRGPRGQRDSATSRGQRPAKVALVAPAAQAEWADKIQAQLEKNTRSVTRLNVEGNAGLSERIKEARGHGAHRILAAGDHQFVRWAAQAMVGSLMPLAPVLLPGSKPLFGFKPIPTTNWEPMVDALLTQKFVKVDMAMGNVNPFVHQLLAGFPASNGAARTSAWRALFDQSALKLKVQVDRASVEGDFWCLAVANADLQDGEVRWLPGSTWDDQRLDLLLVRPRSLWQKWKFMQALKRGEHGAEPGVLRYRGQRVTVHALTPWRYSADGSQTQEASSPMVMEARPQMLRLIVPEAK